MMVLERLSWHVTPEPCEFPSLVRSQRKFLWIHKEVDLARYPVVGLVPKVGHEEKFYQALGFESHDPFLRVSKQGPCLTAVEEDRGDKRPVELGELEA